MAEKATALDNIIKLAVMAVGGQGGGVLTNWIVDLAEANGYAVQATSVACLLYTSPSPRDKRQSRMPSSA